MLDKFSHFISTIGTEGITSSSGIVKYKTFNWILFWTLVSSILWTFMLCKVNQPQAAVFPLSMILIIPTLLFLLYKNKGFHQVLNTFIFLLLALPLLVQMFHGGFINSGAVVVWTILAPITSLIFKKIKVAKAVFGYFILSLAIAVFAEFFIEIPYNKSSHEQVIMQLILNIIAVIAIIYFPILQFTNEMLLQRRIIKSQNSKIISSIEYAKYIQRASLSSDEELSSSLNNDFFLYFEPKDIVGGDFYWVAIKNGRLIIICADCTGHGVPGGFMTMMGINHLNNIVKEKGVTDPSMILLFLHYAIRESLKYSSESITDGMDISVCSIDLEQNLLEFSGARNKLYYQTDKLQVVPPTKVSVGEDVMDVNFSKHQITMKKGDRFYMCSDGYIDQFGGPNGKRFGSKRMTQLLNDIKELDIKEQGKIIEKTMIDWKGNEDQIDDITFMGFIV